MAQLLTRSFFAQSFFLPKPSLTEENLPDQSGRVHIVTGGYAGVGQELVRILYRKNASVYVAGRSKDKAERSIKAIREEWPQSRGRLEFLLVDFADLTTINDAVKAFTSTESRLHVLVNNAGVMFPPRGSKSKQGYELQMATNCLGPFLFTQGLLPTLKVTATEAPKGSVRVIWASSLGTNVLSPPAGVTMGGDGAPKPHESQQTNYGQTKVGNYFYAAELHRRLQGDGILSVSFNPGNLRTELQRHMNPVAGASMIFLGHPAVYGAYTELYAGWSPDITEENGGTFIAPWGRIWPDAVRKDVRQGLVSSGAGKSSLACKFWEWSEKETAKYADSAS